MSWSAMVNKANISRFIGNWPTGKSQVEITHWLDSAYWYKGILVPVN